MYKKTKASTFPVFQGILTLFFSASLFLSLITFKAEDPTINVLGLFGYVLGWLTQYLVGLASFLIPIFFLWISIQLMRGRALSSLKWKISLFCLLLLSLSLLLVIIADTSPAFSSLFKRWVYTTHSPLLPFNYHYYLGGAPLHYLYKDLPFINLHYLFGTTGAIFVALSLLLFAGFYLFNGNFLFAKRLFFFLKEKLKKEIQEPPMKAVSTAPPEESLARAHPLTSQKAQQKTMIAPTQKEEPSPTLSKKKEFPNYTFPAPSLLTPPKKADISVLKSDLKRQAAILEETLLSFGIEAKVGDIHAGPTIISFEVHPAVGVKVQKIKALENDIALNMQAKSIRIIAPIPGKAAVGIELPNPHPQEVNFREVFENYLNNPKKGRVPLLLGKAVNGEDIVADLVKMPHLLIAGATGSGKSVSINTIVMSIVMNTHPDEVKFLMIDPKKVELAAYTSLPHMLTPVITEADEARPALLYLVKEMERRYELFRILGHRNIESFNTRKPNIDLEASFEEEVPKQLPYIVLIIDEFADLMMVSTSDMETPIARIAQMARAVGIHMILATQRPSREVITGLIKANFPSRIAFKVANRINSQIILDECGAESLLGNGDMLLMPPGTSHLTRAQGAFIRDEDIHKVINFVTSQAPVHYLISSFRDFKTPEEQEDEGPSMGSFGKDRERGKGSSGKDTLYEEAKNLVLETGNASTTFLQRKLKIGYARAASLMDELEKGGTIGPQEGAKPRKIFYPPSHLGE